MTAKRADTRQPARKRTPRAAKAFYGKALNAAEQIELEEAAEVQGLDQEIAILRVRLREILSVKPSDLQLMMRGLELLVKAVSARYRLSKEAEEDLAGHIAGVIRGVGGQLMPEAFADE
ncbi:MAG: hypothetical protein WD939_00645 [Dehalococcoidia bacterium]